MGRGTNGLTQRNERLRLGLLTESRRDVVAGRRTRHEDQDGASDYHYDIGDRLHSITGANPTTFTWDANGNMMEKVTDEGITSYFYNARDKMVRVVLDDDSELNYSYYHESDLRYSTTDSGQIEKRFLYEGQNVVEEMDAYNSELVSYIEGMGIDQHLARVANGNAVTYITDALGTVRNVVDASGLALNSYTFKAYGETRDKTEAVENDYQFTGRRFESDTGDYYYRARYYLPQQGMFGAVDRYVPDEMTFAYAGGNPVMMVDPLGLYVTSFANAEKDFSAACRWQGLTPGRKKMRCQEYKTDLDSYIKTAETMLMRHEHMILYYAGSRSEEVLKSMYWWEYGESNEVGDDGVILGEFDYKNKLIRVNYPRGSCKFCSTLRHESK